MLTIKSKPTWNSSDIRNMCIENGWYTKGDIASYSQMLDCVDCHQPELSVIFAVAKDIYDHSDHAEADLQNICFVIANDVVITQIEIEE